MNSIYGRTLHEEYAKGSQSVEYTGLFLIGAKKVKVQIRRDSYDPQSYARAEVWSTTANRWEHAADIHYSQMAALASHAYGPKLTNHEQDVETLLKIVDMLFVDVSKMTVEQAEARLGIYKKGAYR